MVLPASTDDGGPAIGTLLNEGDGGFAIGPLVPTPTGTFGIAPLHWAGTDRAAFLRLAMAGTSGFPADAGGAVLLEPLDDGGYVEGVAWTGGFTTGIESWSFSAGDLNGDGLDDASYVCPDSSGLSALCVSIQGDAGFPIPTAYESASPGSVLPGLSMPQDVTGDGLADLITLEESAPANLTVWRNVDGGAFEAMPTVTMTYGSVRPEFSFEPGVSLAQAMAFGDFLHDGTREVAYVGRRVDAGQLEYAIVILANDGLGHLSMRSTIPVSTAAALVAIDADCDGWLDLTDGAELFLNEHDGGFSGPTAVGSLAAWMLVDLNGDGWPDSVGSAPNLAVSVSH